MVAHSKPSCWLCVNVDVLVRRASYEGVEMIIAWMAGSEGMRELGFCDTNGNWLVCGCCDVDGA